MRFTSFLMLTIFSITQGVAQDMRKQLQTNLIEAADGSIIEIPEGRYQLNMGLSMDGKKNITIRGRGIDKTVLSFKDQLAGAEGLKITNS
jgi:hypothetical protein